MAVSTPRAMSLLQGAVSVGLWILGSSSDQDSGRQVVPVCGFEYEVLERRVAQATESIHCYIFTTPFDEKRDVDGADSAPADRVGYAVRLLLGLVEGSRPLVTRPVIVSDGYEGVEQEDIDKARRLLFSIVPSVEVLPQARRKMPGGRLPP